ncbi:MAG: ethylbenzene dehydrogenase-related protein [Candidatus Brocadia sp.]|nr:ethylbenzene dehydrogenase-related protein [Candidatus Brocadia sp.]
MRILFVLFIGYISFLYADCGWCEETSPLIWESSYSKVTPTIDGKMEKAWEQAKPLTVVVREAMGGDNPTEVVLRALHTDDTLYVMAQWPDATKSDMRDPYIWNADKKEYERPSKPDDQFALEFPLSGNFDIRMITLTHEYSADIWHWKAGRGNPVGWVDDKKHIISQKPIQGGIEYSMGGHGIAYIARFMDEGTTSWFLKPKPAGFEGNVVDSFEQRQPSGSVADVRGKGMHDGKGWILEMSRKLNTGHNDDAVIDPNKDNVCAIAVLNDELYWYHSTSAEITLRFVNNAKK